MRKTLTYHARTLFGVALVCHGLVVSVGIFLRSRLPRPRRLAQRLYNVTLRSHLPLKYRVLAGVAVKDRPLLDMTGSEPDHKQGLVDAIHEHVADGDHIEIVGFGRGVSTIHCLDAGAGHVTGYEAAQSMIEIGKHTLRVNRVREGTVDVRHAVVGEAIEVYGELAGATRVDPSDLSDADVLVLDCEGAEKSILEGLGTEPETIICETHPERGVPTATIAELLADRDVSERQYEPNDESSKRVLVATHSVESDDRDVRATTGTRTPQRNHEANQ